MPVEPNPRDRILFAAVSAIEAVGADRVTVRQITERAGVNVAAVSYYFGGKDALVAEALESTLHESFEQPLRDFDAAIARGTPPGPAFLALLSDQIRDARAWPGIARAHLIRAAGDPAADAVAARASAFLDALAARLDAVETGQPDVRLALAQLWSAVTLGAVAPALVDRMAGLDLAAAGPRDRWVRSLVRAHLPGLSTEG